MDTPLPALAPSASTSADPFAEHTACGFALRRTALGGRFRFASNSEALLALVEAAYGGLPSYELPEVARDFDIELRLVPARPVPRGEPPPVRQHAGEGLLCGVMDESNFAMLDPRGSRALVVASKDMLESPYHLRYELIEFAVFTLATRGMGLVPLHGACVGRNGRGVLLLGASGAGKSTLALHCLLGGLDFLAEDAVFVQPGSLRATGVPNFLHVRPDASSWVGAGRVLDWLDHSARIRRRSGVEKIEADLRAGMGPLARTPLELVAAVFVSGECSGASHPQLVPLGTDEAAARLATDQPYAAGQPGWQVFVDGLRRRKVFELRRGGHPEAAVALLRRVLE